MRVFDASPDLLFVAGFTCFAAFSWGVRSHFRRTEHIPLGTYMISALTLIGFFWFAWRIATRIPAFSWEAALTLFISSLALFIWTVSVSRETPPTLAFDTDEPVFLLDHGPYRIVRHPFYLSYLLFWVATAIATPGLLPWLAPGVMVLVYWNAAIREERKFAKSELSGAYRRYRAKVGRFLPRLKSQSIRD